MNEQASIRCESISVGYGDHVVVGEATLVLHRGEILTLIGPNGAGKSTLLKTLARVLPMLAGTVTLSGRDLMSYKNREIAQKMAVLLTQGKDPGMITCREVIEMGRFPYTNMAGTMTASDRKIVEEAMEQTGVEELAQREYAQISDGQRQRVLLARALCQQPEILILDEPVSYLDIRYKLEFLTTLQRLVKQRNSPDLRPHRMCEERKDPARRHPGGSNGILLYGGAVRSEGRFLRRRVRQCGDGENPREEPGVRAVRYRKRDRNLSRSSTTADRL